MNEETGYERSGYRSRITLRIYRTIFPYHSSYTDAVNK